MSRQARDLITSPAYVVIKAADEFSPRPQRYIAAAVVTPTVAFMAVIVNR
jgi:hypothetical protein